MDKSSAARLEKVHPELGKRVTQLLALLSNLGMDVRVVQGFRTFDEQNKLYNQPRDGKDNDGDGRIDERDEKVTNARGGQSNHNYGLAVDLCPFTNGKADWNNLKAFQIIGREAKALGLEWGGDWKFVDKPHVQLRGMSVKECQAAYANGSIARVWSRMYELLGGSKPQTFTPAADDVLEFGDKGAAIVDLQTQLAKLNFLRTYEIDGEFGKITKNAVIGFQRQNNLTADGIVGPGTKAKLKAALDAKNTLNSISAAVPASLTIKDQPAKAEPSVNSVSGESQSNQTDPLPNPAPENSQTAENLVNVNTGANPLPADFKPETKEIEAPPPSGIMSRGWRWLLGMGLVPTTGAGLIESVKGFTADPSWSWSKVFEVMQQVLIFLMPYLVWVAIAFIAFWGIKELLKQISFIVNQYTLARGDMNNVKVLPSGDWKNAELPKLPESISVVGKE